MAGQSFGPRPAPGKPEEDGRADCEACGKPLTSDEIGATRKFLGPRRTKYLCLSCLSAELGADPGKLREKIEDYRRMGCVYFSPGPPEERE